MEKCNGIFGEYKKEIDIDMANSKLIEVFQYVGKVPDTPEIIINSGRMFAPVFMVHAFKTRRWRFLFDNPHYDKWVDSDYENITFYILYRLPAYGKAVRMSGSRNNSAMNW